MEIYAGRKEYLPTWVNAKKFDILWHQSEDSLFVEEWTGEPKKVWFKHSDNNERIGFQTADASFDIQNGKVNVEFLNGRHRTRWRLQQDNLMIPIGLTDASFEKAVKLGLDPKRIN